MRWWLSGIIILWMVIPGAGLAGEVVYVQGAQAPLYAAPQLGQAPVAMVGHGTALSVIDGNSRWYQVEGEGYQGWVVKLMVAHHPPVKQPATPEAAMEVLMKRARVRPSTYSTTAAARGLREGGEGLEDAHQVDYGQVTEMEGFQPTAEAVADFIHTDAVHE